MGTTIPRSTPWYRWHSDLHCTQVSIWYVCECCFVQTYNFTLTPGIKLAHASNDVLLLFYYHYYYDMCVCVCVILLIRNCQLRPILGIWWIKTKSRCVGLQSHKPQWRIQYISYVPKRATRCSKFPSVVYWLMRCGTGSKVLRLKLCNWYLFTFHVFYRGEYSMGEPTNSADLQYPTAEGQIR